MRLNFPNGEHADVAIDEQIVAIGSDAGNRIVLNAPGVVARHARVIADHRGIVLEVVDANARTHVNARPVRELALLHPGDTISIDTVVIAVIADNDGRSDIELPANWKQEGAAVVAPSLVLRGVSGKWFGKSISLGRTLRFGTAANGDTLIDSVEPGSAGATIRVGGGRIVLSGGGDESVRVNGLRVRNALLRSGDQIGIGRDRFLVEAPGLEADGVRDPTPATPLPDSSHSVAGAHDFQEPSSRSRNAIIWLIGAAALMGAGLATVLLLAH